jgi:hypothetical protein
MAACTRSARDNVRTNKRPSELPSKSHTSQREVRKVLPARARRIRRASSLNNPE